MRWLIWVILLFAIAVGLSMLARFSNGNIAILWPPYKVDVSINVVLTLLVVGFLLLHLLLLGLYKALALPERVREYRESRTREKAQQALAGALLAWFEGRFGRAERLAREAQSIPQTSSLASLIGARAAHRMKQFGRRDEWLAQVNDPVAKNAKLLTQAELWVDEQKPGPALDAIAQAQKGGRRHIQALRLQLRAHEQNGDWEEVLRLVNQLDKRDALHPVTSQQLRINAYRKLIPSADPAQLAKRWAEIKNQPDIRSRLAGLVAKALRDYGNSEAATSIYEQELDEAFNASFARQYMLAEHLSLSQRLKTVEGWRARYGDEPELLVAMGELCRREKLWGKSKAFLEQAINAAPSPEAHIALAKLYEATERPDLAQSHYRQAAALAVLDGDRL